MKWNRNGIGHVHVIQPLAGKQMQTMILAVKFTVRNGRSAAGQKKCLLGIYGMGMAAGR